MNLSQLSSSEQIEHYPRSSANREVQSNLESQTMADGTELEQLALSGLWLLHGFLHESHEISQDCDSAEGSFWHAIMHRLEGDFWNSKYWYRRVRQHPVFEQLTAELNNVDGAAARFPGGWSAEAFVDLCEAAESDAVLEPMARKLAQAEWRCLFEYCCQS